MTSISGGAPLPPGLSQVFRPPQVEANQVVAQDAAVSGEQDSVSFSRESLALASQTEPSASNGYDDPLPGNQPDPPEEKDA